MNYSKQPAPNQTPQYPQFPTAPPSTNPQRGPLQPILPHPTNPENPPTETAGVANLVPRTEGTFLPRPSSGPGLPQHLPSTPRRRHQIRHHSPQKTGQLRKGRVPGTGSACVLSLSLQNTQGFGAGTRFGSLPALPCGTRKNNVNTNGSTRFKGCENEDPGSQGSVGRTDSEEDGGASRKEELYGGPKRKTPEGLFENTQGNEKGKLYNGDELGETVLKDKHQTCTYAPLRQE